MENFYTRVMGWATARNILKGSPWQKQRTKTWEELTELAEGISKSKLDLAKDAIGDCSVTVSNMAGCLGLDVVQLGVMASETAAADQETFDQYDLDGLLNLFVQHTSVVRTESQSPRIFDIITGFGPQHHIVVAMAALEHCATRLGLSFEDCQEHAWSEIKDRKGMMISGVFVKEEDLAASLESIVKHEAAALANDHQGWMALWLSTDDLCTEEEYCAQFRQFLRERLESIIAANTFGLHVDGEIKITYTGKSDFFDSLETMSLVVNVVFFVDAESRPIHVTILQHVGGAMSSGKVVEPSEYQTNVWELDFEDIQIVRRHGVSDLTPAELGDLLIQGGRLPEHTTAAAVTMNYFDNDVPFFGVRFSVDDGKLTYHVAALTLV